MYVCVFEMDTPGFITAETNDSVNALFCFYLFPVAHCRCQTHRGHVSTTCSNAVKILLKAKL